MYFWKEVDIQTLITFVFTWRGAYIFKKIKIAKKKKFSGKNVWSLSHRRQGIMKVFFKGATTYNKNNLEGPV